MFSIISRQFKELKNGEQIALTGYIYHASKCILDFKILVKCERICLCFVLDVGKLAVVILSSVYLYTFILSFFAHGAMGRRINPSWSGPIELFLVPASAPRLV